MYLNVYMDMKGDGVAYSETETDASKLPENVLILFPDGFKSALAYVFSATSEQGADKLLIDKVPDDASCIMCFSKVQPACSETKDIVAKFIEEVSYYNFLYNRAANPFYTGDISTLDRVFKCLVQDIDKVESWMFRGEWAGLPEYEIENNNMLKDALGYEIYMGKTYAYTVNRGHFMHVISGDVYRFVDDMIELRILSSRKIFKNGKRNNYSIGKFIKVKASKLILQP